MSTTREAGDRGEAMAAEYLRENGYEILASQFRCRFGEIDLIARRGDILCFVEVKLRYHCQAAAYPHHGGLLHDAARSRPLRPL